MYKALAVAVFAFVAILFVPTSAHASNGTGDTLRHAYKPYQVTGRNAVNARVDNFSTQPVKRLVCVEAFNNSSGVKTHLGCLWVDLASYNSQGNWAYEFETPTGQLRPGSYRVVYTYQGSDGGWYHIKSVTMQVTDGMYTAP